MTKEEYDRMYALLIEAAGSRLNKADPGLQVLGPIQSWVAQGYSFDLDILPAIRKAAKKGSSTITSWNYFKIPVQNYAAMRQRQKIASSRHANSKGFDKEDKPRAPKHVRKAQVAEWDRIKERMRAKHEI